MNETTGTTSNVALFTAESPRMDEILRAIELTQARVYDALVIPYDLIREPCPLPTAERILGDAAVADAKLRGIQIVVSSMLDGMTFPVRVHRKRKGMSEAYHRRIQKKWNKRFGKAPAWFLMNTKAMGSTVRSATRLINKENQ